MDAPADGAADRRGVPAAVPLVSGEAAGSGRGCAGGCGRSSALGALQGAVGWWMVASGLAERVERLAVSAGDASHARLRDLRGDALDGAARSARARRSRCRRASARARSRCSCSCCCRSISARWSPGLRAGLIYNTWPLIDGSFIPDSVSAAVPRHAGVAQSLRERADGAVQPPHRRPMRCGCSHCCMRSTSRGRCAAAAP